METTTTAEPGGHLWPIVRDAMEAELTDETFAEWLTRHREAAISFGVMRTLVIEATGIGPSIQTFIHWAEALGLETGRQKPTIR